MFRPRLSFPKYKGTGLPHKAAMKSSETTIKMLTFFISNSVILLGGYTTHDILIFWWNMECILIYVKMFIG